MIKPRCDKCGKELTEYGGLAFSPPDTMVDGAPSKEIFKYHICRKCWKQFILWLLK
jgi:hypothetical protein